MQDETPIETLILVGMLLIATNAVMLATNIIGGNGILAAVNIVGVAASIAMTILWSRNLRELRENRSRQQALRERPHSDT